MTLTAGIRLGPYEVQSPLGAGGMGEVYRARDTKLNRDVALKVLPELFAADVDRLARFKREAQVLASLNHPNIAAIHGFEDSGDVQALVLEFVDGPTLADRISQGPIPLDEALPIARQIAEALEAAHEHGVIHRDLKPANIKVRADGTVKVLDFGLAKLTETAGVTGTAAAVAVSNSPTITSPAMMTGVGVLLGTAAYMSPEQAKGKPADKRSDIWAFGCVLYEMLSGARAFNGEDVADTLVEVLKGDVVWSALPEDTPLAIRRLLRRALTKNVRERLSDAHTAQLEIQEALAPADVHGAMRVQSGSRPRMVFIAAGALAVGAVVGGSAVWALRPASAIPAVSQLTITLPESDDLVDNNAGSSVALSPDGSTLVYAANRDGRPQLFRRAMSNMDFVPIPGTEGANFPTLSPDGQSIAFVRGSRVLRMSLGGGPATTLYETNLGANKTPTRLCWGPNDTIVFGFTGNGDGLMQVAAAGGAASPLTRVDPAAGETDHRQPEVLPGGEAVLFTVWSSPSVSEGIESAEIVAHIFSTGERRKIIAGAAPQFAASGHLLFTREDGLWAVPFAPSLLAVTGPAVRVLEGVKTRGTGQAQLALSANGTLVYEPGIFGDFTSLRTLAWVDRNGVRDVVGAPPRAYVYARLSPDGSQIALDARDEQTDIWVWSVQRRTLTRLTFDPGQNISPVWTRDGARIVFGGEPADGGPGLFWQAADGAGSVERLTSESVLPMPTALMPDGARLLFHLLQAQRNISALTLSGQRRSELLLQTSFDEANAELSPDGRWLAYSSNESGRYEIYVRPFPDVTTGRWQMSSGGGTRPMWARNARSLFYMTEPLLTLMEVPVEGGARFAAGTPRVVIKGPNGYIAPQYGRPYDVSIDGQRFLMIQGADTAEASAPIQSPLIVVQNWLEELKRLVPAN